MRTHKETLRSDFEEIFVALPCAGSTMTLGVIDHGFGFPAIWASLSGRAFPTADGETFSDVWAPKNMYFPRLLVIILWSTSDMVRSENLPAIFPECD